MTATLYTLLYILVSHLALGAVAYYYRARGLRAEDALKMLKEIGAQWRVSNAQLARRVESAERALLERHKKEAADDAVVQERAGGSADLAVDLLNGLHQGSPGGDPGPGPGVQPRPDADVPGPEGRKVHRR